MSDLIGGAVAMYFGNPQSSLSIEEKLKRDIAALERSTNTVRKNRKLRNKLRSKSRNKGSKRKSKRMKRKKHNSNRTLRTKR